MSLSQPERQHSYFWQMQAVYQAVLWYRLSTRVSVLDANSHNDYDKICRLYHFERTMAVTSTICNKLNITQLKQFHPINSLVYILLTHM